MANKEDWLRAVWNFTLWLWDKIGEFAHYCFDKLLAEEVHFSFMGGFFLFAISTLMIGSGCWAASIAISRRHNGKLHFLLGALIPLLYPFIIMFAMGLKGEGERRKLLEEEQKAKDLAAAEKQKVLEIQKGGVKAEVIETSEFNVEFFKKIARDAEGDKAGPWKVVFAGNEIKVLEILEAHPDLVLVEMLGREDTKEKIRIPYNRIDSWQDLNSENS